MDLEILTPEQKIIKYLATTGYLTSVGDVSKALEDSDYADYLITGDGLYDEIVDSGIIGGDCNHESLTNEEIQEVFDNDYMRNNSSKNKLTK